MDDYEFSDDLPAFLGAIDNGRSLPDYGDPSLNAQFDVTIAYEFSGGVPASLTGGQTICIVGDYNLLPPGQNGTPSIRLPVVMPTTSTMPHWVAVDGERIDLTRSSVTDSGGNTWGGFADFSVKFYPEPQGNTHAFEVKYYDSQDSFHPELSGTLTVEFVHIPSLDINGYALPNGVENTAYYHDISADVTNGVAPYIFALEGSSALPIGLSLSSSGVISGTPMQAVTGHSFDVTVTDSKTPTAQTDTATYSITVSNPSASVTSVTVSPSTASVVKGNTQQFTANAVVENGAQNTVTWSVSGGMDSSIDANGLLAVGANETATTLTVTATSDFDNITKGTATVTVTQPQPPSSVPVTVITVTGGSSITEKGGTVQLTANITPNNAGNQTVTWSSSDTGIATVDASGLVTAVSNGTVTIRATAQDGSNVYGEKQITVSGQESPASIRYSVLSAFITFTGSGNRMAKIDADSGKFVRLLYNNAEVSTANYTVTRGSTVITLNESYLKTFANGTYAFRAEFTDGYADLTLKVNSAQDTDVPQMGDTSDMELWFALLCMGTAGIVGAYVWEKKRKASSRK